MSETPASAAPQLEGTMFLFTKPALLNKENHSQLGVSRPDRPFSFAEKVRAIPLTLSEIPAASKNYPIIFSDLENPVPLAVVGLVDDLNLFVGEDGEWEQNAYIPGYLRRYPFALASDKQSDPNNPRMAMIVDEAYPGVHEGGDLPFFENGEPSEAMQQAMEYCQTYERDRMMTLQFAQAIKPYGLLTEQLAQFTPEGAEQPQPFAKYVGTDESKLTALPDDKFLEMRKSNILPLIHMQLSSMSNWRLLMERRARRFDLRGMDVLKPISTN